MNDPAPTAVAIARLEARIARLTAATAFLTIALAALVAWQFVPRPGGLEARAFVLRDEAGRRRAELGFRDDGSPGLKLLDSRQRTRLTVHLAGEAPGGLVLRDQAGRDRLRVGLLDDGTPAMGLLEADGTSRVDLRGGDRPALRMRDAVGSEVVRLP